MNTYLVLFLLFSALSFIGFLWLAIVAFKRGVVWGLAVLLLSPITAIVFSLMNWFEARKAFLLYITTFLLSFGSLIFIYSQVGLGNMQQITAKMHRGELTPQQAYQLLGRALQGDHGDLFAATATTAKQQLASDPKTKPGQTIPSADKPPAQVDATQPQTHTQAPAKPTPPAVKPAVDKTPATQDRSVAQVQAKPTKVASATKAADPPAASKPAQDPVEEDPSVPNINKVQKDPLAQHNQPPSDKVTVRLSRISHYIGRSFLITLKNGTTHRGILRKVSRTRLELDLQLYGGNFVYRVSKDQIRKIQMYKRVRMD